MGHAAHLMAQGRTIFRITGLCDNFFRNSINNSKGEEKNRYIYIYMTLTSTNNKLVHDQNLRTDPVFSKIGKFLGTHIEDIEKLPYEMTYKEYSNYKELKNQKDYEL